MRITLILGSFEKSFMPSVGTGMGVEDALADMLGQADLFQTQFTTTSGKNAWTQPRSRPKVNSGIGTKAVTKCQDL
jgi:hypothetical protein